MRKILSIALFALACVACDNFETVNPFRDNLKDMSLTLLFPEGFESFERPGVTVKIEEINLSNRYTLTTGAGSSIKAKLPAGLYRIAAQDINGDDIFNGSLDRVLLNGNVDLTLPLSHSVAGRIVVKEIYCGGCMKYPEQGTYQSDQYVILHNNYTKVQYLDSLCFGSLAPYNSNSNNPYGSTLPDFLPIIQAVWQFPGSGSTFPLQPGEDAVICLRGAINHKEQYPLSVNLDKEDYFVCYNPTYFANPTYHPVPGSNIQESRWLDVVIKTGQANAYTFSINSPALAIFKAPAGKSMAEYLAEEGAVEQLPGSSKDRVSKIKPEWVMDAVEVFNGSESSNKKRILSTLDAGYVTLSGTFLGHSLFRKVDEAQTQLRGYEVLVDTNNSSADFYEREKQSLNE